MRDCHIGSWWLPSRLHVGTIDDASCRTHPSRWPCVYTAYRHVVQPLLRGGATHQGDPKNRNFPNPPVNSCPTSALLLPSALYRLERAHKNVFPNSRGIHIPPPVCSLCVRWKHRYGLLAVLESRRNEDAPKAYFENIKGNGAPRYNVCACGTYIFTSRMNLETARKFTHPLHMRLEKTPCSGQQQNSG